MITQYKAHPFSTAKIYGSVNSNINRCATFAEKVNYPYLLILGEKDMVVDNSAARAWHSKTSSKNKDLKLMPGAYHELSKEPNNSVMFETILKFAVRQANDGVKPFGHLLP
jgi:alpha-beta hydrolase superfamily lysophospholipase